MKTLNKIAFGVISTVIGLFLYYDGHVVFDNVRAVFVWIVESMNWSIMWTVEAVYSFYVFVQGL